MKLPRWLVIAMLTSSVLSVLAAAGWWWVTWPERTSREFQMLLVERKWNDAVAMILSSDYPADTVIAWLARNGQDELELEPLPWSWGDVCRGRRQFKLGEKNTLRFTAEKGRITEANTWVYARYGLPTH